MLTRDDLDAVTKWYASRRYDIGRDEMVSDSPPPACIADHVAKHAEVDRRYREGMKAVYAAWARGEENPRWPSLQEIMPDVFGWTK